MKTIKKSAVILLIMVLCMLLAGCSNEESALFNMSMDSNNLCLGPVQQTGEITFKTKNWETVLKNTNLDAKQQAVLQKILELQALKYDVKFDLSKNVMEYTFYYKNGINMDYTELVKLIMVNDSLYIKLDKLCEFLRSTANPAVIAYLDRGVRDAEYLMITPESYLNSLGVTTSEAEYANFSSMFNLSKQMKTNQLMMKFMEGLINQVYTNYKTGFVTLNGNKYTVSLDASQIAPCLKEFLFYTLDNFDKFADYACNFINNMTEEELALLNLNTDIKKEIIDGLEIITPMISLNKEQYKEKITEVLDAANEEIVGFLGNSSFVSGIEKINDTEYKSDTSLELNINIDGKLSNFSVDENQNMKPCHPFPAPAPSGKMLTLEELQARVNRVLKINIDSGSWELREDQTNLRGTSTVKIIDGYTYLPLRQIAETLGEEVYWDTDKSKAYIERNGQRVYLTGVIIKGTLYVKTRDFANIGYKVDWDAKSRTVKLTRPAF